MCMRPDGRRDGGPCGHSRRKRALKTSIRCTSRKRGLLPLACTFATLLLFVGCEIHARRIITAFSYSNPKGMSMQFAHESVLPPLPRIKTPSTADTESAVLSDESNPWLSVLYTNDPKMVSRWLSDHVATGGCTLGFDLESVPDAPWITRTANFRGPALVQLATPKSSLVIHLARPDGRFSGSCGPLIEAVLSDETVVKAGVSVDQDMLELRQKWPRLEARSRLDLGGIGASGSQRLGLKKLTDSILGIELPKSRRLAASDWSQVPLTQAQLAYSARDAWAGAAIISALAARDPSTFGTPGLVDLLQSQRSIDDLFHRRIRRKAAKNQLASVLSPYSFEEKKRQHVRWHEVPTWKANVVSDLRDVMQENRADQGKVFDVAPLGFSIVTKNQTDLRVESNQTHTK